MRPPETKSTASGITTCIDTPPARRRRASDTTLGHGSKRAGRCRRRSRTLSTEIAAAGPANCDQVPTRNDWENHRHAKSPNGAPSADCPSRTLTIKIPALRGTLREGKVSFTRMKRQSARLTRGSVANYGRSGNPAKKCLAVNTGSRRNKETFFTAKSRQPVVPGGRSWATTRPAGRRRNQQC